MPQTLKEILNENKLLFAGVTIPYILAASLTVGAEKGMISSPDEYVRRLYRAIAGEKYSAYIAIGRQIPVSGINPGFGEGDKVPFDGSSIEVLVINVIKKEIRVSVNEEAPLLLKLNESKHTQNGGLMTLLEINTENERPYVDLAISDEYEIKVGQKVIKAFFCPREIKLLSASNSKAVVQVGNEEIHELSVGERQPTSEGTILTLLKIEK